MLEKLLKEIRAGGTLETRALAIKLGTSPQLVEIMLEHLQSAGYIRSYIRCNDGCQGCSLHEACGIKKPDPLRLWQSIPEV
jgi:hypothetical protein